MHDLFPRNTVCSKVLFYLLFPSLSEGSLAPHYARLFFFKAVCLAFSAHLLWEWAVLGNGLKLSIGPKLELYGH